MKKKTTKPAPNSTTKRKSKNPIRDARQALGLRVDDVAVSANCGVATIYRCERNGILPPNRNTRAAVCAALGIPVPA